MTPRPGRRPPHQPRGGEHRPRLRHRGLGHLHLGPEQGHPAPHRERPLRGFGDIGRQGGTRTWRQRPSPSPTSPS
jgi:hypothetical protein